MTDDDDDDYRLDFLKPLLGNECGRYFTEKQKCILIEQIKLLEHVRNLRDDLRNDSHRTEEQHSFSKLGICAAALLPVPPDGRDAFLPGEEATLFKEALGRFRNALQSAKQSGSPCSPWSLCLKAAQYPDCCFRRLTNQIDLNIDFADWLAKPEEAALDLKKATDWEPDTIAHFKSYFAVVGFWDKITSLDPDKWPLAMTGPAFGVEIELLNRHQAKNQKRLLEVATPPTTDLQEWLAPYLRKVQAYFINCAEEGLLSPGYYWGTHLSLSLSEKALPNVVLVDPTDKSERITQPAQSPYDHVARMLLFPANPFGRNVQMADPDRSYSSVAAINVSRSYTAPERKDKARLEMKCASICADTDVDYMMDCLRVMQVLTEHPDSLKDFTKKLTDLYEKHRLMLPKEFKDYSKKPPHEIPYSVIAQFDAASVRFRSEAREYFSAFLAEQIPGLHWRTKASSERQGSPSL